MYGYCFSGRSTKKLGRTTIDDGYLRSGVWKCSKSPTGAHYWREIRNSKPKGLFYCIHCKDVKRFPIAFGEISGEVYGRIPVTGIHK